MTFNDLRGHTLQKFNLRFRQNRLVNECDRKILAKIPERRKEDFFVRCRKLKFFIIKTSVLILLPLSSFLTQVYHLPVTQNLNYGNPKDDQIYLNSNKIF